ncbi:MAG: potassium channel family protein [Candidatus Acetothermia bacterium]
MRVIITGMGDIGTQLAEDLSSRGGFELVLIDKNEAKCQALSQEMDALVLNGDGTEPGILDKAGATNADSLIATTESDALNMVIAILGKKFSIPQVVVKLNKMGLRTACQEIGVDHVISPKLSAAMEITSLLHGYDVLDFSLLIRGGARLSEMTPGEMEGHTIEEIDLPDGALVIAILRDNVATIPKGKTKLRKEDILLILAENDKTLESVINIFGDLKTADRARDIHGAQ